jgi:hypothetical protein
MQRITVNVVLPGAGLLHVQVEPQQGISSLASRVRQDRRFDFVFKGQVLDQQWTFDDYNIQDNETLIAINQISGRARQRWMRLTDDDDFQEIMRCATNAKSHIEFLRLHDVHRMRLESRPRTFRRICRTQIGNAADATECPVGSSVLNERPSELSTGPLPVLW